MKEKLQDGQAIPATGWVAERVEDDGTRSVMPLAGWWITSEGDALPLPRSLDSNWICRPLARDDERLITATAGRMRPQPQRTEYFQS
jgi:hypothetical protein